MADMTTPRLYLMPKNIPKNKPWKLQSNGAKSFSILCKSHKNLLSGTFEFLIGVGLILIAVVTHMLKKARGEHFWYGLLTRPPPTGGTVNGRED